MDPKVEYTRLRYGVPVTGEFDTVDAALHSAAWDMYEATAWPYKIDVDGVTVLIFDVENYHLFTSSTADFWKELVPGYKRPNWFEDFLKEKGDLE